MDCSDGYFQNGVASKNFSSSKSSYFSIEIWPIAGDISPLIGAPLQLHSFYLLPFRLLHSLWYFGINMESGKYEPNYTLLTYQPSTCHLPKNIGTVLVSPKKGPCPSHWTFHWPGSYPHSHQFQIPQTRQEPWNPSLSIPKKCSLVLIKCPIKWDIWSLYSCLDKYPASLEQSMCSSQTPPYTFPTFSLSRAFLSLKVSPHLQQKHSS